MSNYGYARCEGILIVLQKLGKKEGFPITKEYVIQKLTELELTEYIEPLITNYFTK